MVTVRDADTWRWRWTATGTREVWEPAGSRNRDCTAQRPCSRGEIPCRTVNRNSSAEGWAGGGVEGILLGAKLGLAFINICMNDLAETINSTLMQSPVRWGGSQGQILSSAAAAQRDHKVGWTRCDASTPPADEGGGAAPVPTPRLPPTPHECIACRSPGESGAGELQNAIVALISRKSISTGKSGLSKENSRDESQEALREVLLLHLPFMHCSRVVGKRGWKSRVAWPGWSGSSALLEPCSDWWRPGSEAVAYNLMERMAETPSRMTGKESKSWGLSSPGDGIVGALQTPTLVQKSCDEQARSPSYMQFLCCHPCLPGWCWSTGAQSDFSLPWRNIVCRTPNPGCLQLMVSGTCLHGLTAHGVLRDKSCLSSRINTPLLPGRV